MFDFTEEQKMVRKMIRKWVEAKLKPANADLEAEKVLPYELMRDFIDTFGVAELARAQLKRFEDKESGDKDKSSGSRGPSMRDVGMTSIVAIEQARVSPGVCHGGGRFVGVVRFGDHAQRHAAAEASLCAARHDGREDRCLGHHRAASGIRCLRRDAHRRAPNRRRLHLERAEDLHLERAVRRHPAGLCQARAR